jgi:hypothetical protein
MRTRTPDGAREQRVYLRFVAWLLAERPWCERCGNRESTVVHHRRTLKQGGARICTRNCRALCRWCHTDADDAIHRNPEVSYATGWLIREGSPEWADLGIGHPPEHLAEKVTTKPSKIVPRKELA